MRLIVPSFLSVMDFTLLHAVTSCSGPLQYLHEAAVTENVFDVLVRSFPESGRDIV